jgi:hypothetical protein
LRDIDMRIAADGTWFYCGSPIGRAPLVQFFTSTMSRRGEFAGFSALAQRLEALAEARRPWWRRLVG